MTSSTLGPAPIVDFDGTLACLDITWHHLRARLNVQRINDLWRSDDPDAWSIVTSTETEAAGRAAPVEPLRVALESSATFAVLTDNSEHAVARFFERFAALKSRAALVVGRESLAGPKSNYELFQRGFARCIDATSPARGNGSVVFVGDTDWELRFARRLGAHAVDVRHLDAGS